MQVIIAPTDFSRVSLNAVDYAADMAVALQASLLIVHSTELPFSAKGIFTETSNDEMGIYKKLNALKEEILARINNKIIIHTKQVTGVIEDELIRMCDQKNPLAVVMATHGEGLQEFFFIGSTTVYLSKNLNYPLIIVPGFINFTPVNKILLASDLENMNELPFDKIIDMITAFKASIDIVHVYNNENKFEVMSGRISELSYYLKNLNPQFHFVKHNNIQHAIIDFAKRNNSDLILTFPKKHAFFHKSKSKQFILHSPVTVMSIRQPQ
ncbi:MAG TPA: universal stress protein [Parafilimonas sp.]|nr:universal stress protein [Parafilimonas sp.]